MRAEYSAVASGQDERVELLVCKSRLRVDDDMHRSKALRNPNLRRKD